MLHCTSAEVAYDHAGFTGFHKLQTLLLRDNQLSTWADVDGLDRLPSLADLRLTGNPILHDARGGGRFEVSQMLLSVQATMHRM